MPAVITHHLFGMEFAAANPEAIGLGVACRDAFLLGNQGPDPLFYAVADPRIARFAKLGSDMHHDAPSMLLAALRRAADALPVEVAAVGRAYAHGFLCHYALDRAEHPLIYAQQYAICDAGEPGLTRENGGDVHAAIESDLDEMVLSVKRGATISQWRPYEQCLQADDRSLAAIGLMYSQVAAEVFALMMPGDAFGLTVKSFRRIQRLFYCPGDAKRRNLAAVERLVGRPYSFYSAMAHRDLYHEESPYDNRAHESWEDPFTGEIRTEGFWDLFERAQAEARALIAAFDAPGFDEKAAHELTRGLNFSGEPAE